MLNLLLKMEEAGSFEMLVNFDHISQRHICRR